VKIQATELTGQALLWTACLAEGWEPFVRTIESKDAAGVVTVAHVVRCRTRQVSALDWALCGPIIEREGIAIRRLRHGAWMASDSTEYGNFGPDAPTPLIAAMRCFVASKLGEEVDVPEELLA
jgi:hypothetical protein